MKSNHPLYEKLEKCIDTLLAHNKVWLTLLVLLVLAALIPIMTLLEQPDSLGILAAATATVLTAPSLSLVIALIGIGCLLTLAGVWILRK